MTVLRTLYADPAVLALDFEAYRRQETIFVSLSLTLYVVLLLLHSLFSFYWGAPSIGLVAVIGAAFALKAGELVWLRRRSRPLAPAATAVLTWLSIALNLGLAIVLASLTDREDSQYFALLVIPVLEAAFRFPLVTTLGVIVAAGAVAFFWVWRFFMVYGAFEVGEYFEAGTMFLIFAMVGVLAWLLVNHLRQRESALALNARELDETRGRLVVEEKLAAVGRLSSGIAHEIRNPVAMIASSLAAARRLEGAEREEMFEIAAKEAARLADLTADFLAYARTKAPNRRPCSVSDTVRYVADVCRPHAGQRDVTLTLDAPGTVMADIDGGQVQQALLNLVMNAVDASAAGDAVHLCARSGGADGMVWIDVENAGPPIPAPALARIFEPFFTTKSGGTGLGLAIARSMARAHGGDVILAQNGPQRVRFSMRLPSTAPAASGNR